MQEGSEQCKEKADPLIIFNVMATILCYSCHNWCPAFEITFHEGGSIQ